MARSRKPNRRSGRVARTLSQRMLYWKRDRYVIGSVGQVVEGDDAEDGGGEEGAGGDEEEGGLGAEGGGGELAELRVAAPGAESGGEADDEGGEGERDEEELEADVGAGGEPVDDVARGLGGLVGGGLNVAEEEREHEESGGGGGGGVGGGGGGVWEGGQGCFTAKYRGGL